MPDQAKRQLDLFTKPPACPVDHAAGVAPVPPPVEVMRQLDVELASADPTRAPPRRRRDLAPASTQTTAGVFFAVEASAERVTLAPAAAALGTCLGPPGPPLIIRWVERLPEEGSEEGSPIPPPSPPPPRRSRGA